MFSKIKLFGVIASDLEAAFFGDEGLITLKKVETFLKESNGNDIEVDFSSIGGVVDVGVDIYFAFRDYKRQFPQAQMILNIKSQCASMASHIASGEFWDIVTVEDISSWMLHNPSNGIYGDYRDMQANADYLSRLSTLFSDSYSRRAEKTVKEIRKMMDDTTYLFGKEIVEAGFADEVLATADSDKSNKDSMIAQMQLKYNSTMEKIKQLKYKPDDFERAVAKLKDDEKITMHTPAIGGVNNIQEVVIMNFDEAKKTFSAELANIEQAGKDQGKAEMIANNKAIMEFMNKPEYKALPFVQERCTKALESGESFADMKLSVQALMLDPKNQAAIESPKDLNAGGSSSVSGETSSAGEAKVEW